MSMFNRKETGLLPTAMVASTAMKLIDAHVHLYPPEINADPKAWAAKAGEMHWATLCTRVRKSGVPVQTFPNVSQLLHAMDAARIERAVLLGWYWEKNYSCVLQNRFFQRCIQEYPDRLAACATFHPHIGAAGVEEELRWAKDHGFCGIGEMSPHSQDFSVQDPAWLAALEIAAELGLPINLHVTEPLSKNYPGRVLTPLIDLVELARCHPSNVFVLAHWGARLPLDPIHGKDMAERRNVYFDTAASPLLYGSTVFREMINTVGADRIIFGSDYPLILFPNVEREPGVANFVAQIEALGVEKADAEKLLHGTAAKVYGL